MTNQEIIEKINRYQNNPYVHPLTCGNNSLHSDLIAKELDGKVVLSCSNCDYIQTEIPDITLIVNPDWPPFSPDYYPE